MSQYFTAESAVIEGNVTIGEDSGIWHNSTVRGDSAPITIGNCTNVQDNVVIHVDKDCPTSIGNGVTIGHGAIIHGCSIEDNSLIGMGAIILNHAKIGKDCIIGAGALVPQGMVIPDKSLAFGSPAKIIRTLSQEEMQANRENAREYVLLARKRYHKKH